MQVLTDVQTKTAAGVCHPGKGRCGTCVQAPPGLSKVAARSEPNQKLPHRPHSPTTAVPRGEAPPRSAGTMGWRGGRCLWDSGKGGDRATDTVCDHIAPGGCAATGLSFPRFGIPTEPSAPFLDEFPRHFNCNLVRPLELLLRGKPRGHACL